MSECRSEDLQDLLPDLAAERLSGAERARVAAHAASCEACTAELELLRVARRVMSRGASEIDVARIVAALPRAPGATSGRPALVVASTPALPLAATPRVDRGRGEAVAGRRAAPHRRAALWGGWRIAAAATIAIGGLSVAVIHELAPAASGGSVTAAAPSSAPAPARGPGSVTSGTASRAASVPRHPPTTPATTAPTSPGTGPAIETAPGLAVPGDVSELSDGDVETLVQDMSGLDAQPLSDPDAAVPAISNSVTP